MKKERKKNGEKKVLSEKQKKAKLIFQVLLWVFIAYSIFCLCRSGSSLVSMTLQNQKCRNVELGQARYEEILASGVQAKYSYYTEEEIAQDSDLEVTALYHFPNKTGEKKNYILPIKKLSLQARGCAIALLLGFKRHRKLDKILYLILCIILEC